MYNSVIFRFREHWALVLSASRLACVRPAQTIIRRFAESLPMVAENSWIVKSSAAWVRARPSRKNIPINRASNNLSCLDHRQQKAGVIYALRGHHAQSPFADFFFAAAFFDRTSALFAAAFLATAERASGVIVSMRRFAPFFPSFRRCAESSSETLFFAICLA
jgi:hypothetical protein